MNIINPILLIIKFWNYISSELMKGFLRINGAKIGTNTFVSFSSRIVAKKIVIGNDCNILSNVKIKANQIFIGDSCTLSSDCFISGDHNLAIGDKTYLGKKARIDLSRNVTIGTDVGFGENSVIWTHGYFPPADEGYPVTYADVVIEDHAWVSTGIIILPGVTIGHHTIIGAGSVVTKTFPPAMVVAGNPAKTIKHIQEIKNNKPFLETMESILDSYNSKELLSKKNQGNYIEYKFKDVQIVLSDSFEKIDLNKLNRETIILSKNINKVKLGQGKFNYFDFEDKKRLRTKNKNVLQLDFFLLGFGIRFLKVNENGH